MSNKNTSRSISKVNSGAISPGKGYSLDSQQIASQGCFNVTADPISGQTSYIQLDKAMSFLDFQRELHVDVTAKSKFWMFSGNAEAHYMRSVQNQDASMSLNYFQYAAGTVSVSLLGYGKDALNKFGQSAYNDGKNPYFGLLCGDNIIDSYQEGALLALGINLQFKSSYGKAQFKAIAGASFADIFSASAEIQKVINKSNIAGSLAMQAFQLGGDPSQLAHILSVDPSGDYYATSCSLAAMDKCIKAANGLLDYAKNNFQTQFSFKDGKGLTPLGVGFIHYVPIEFIGLHSQSFVTPEVLEHRKQLASALQENQYYQQKFNGLVNGYIVPWNTMSNLFKVYDALLKQASTNVNRLMDIDPNQGPIGCYDFPYQCNSIYETIMSELKPITANNLTTLDAIRYAIWFDIFVLYKNGDMPSSWDAGLIHANSIGDHFKSLDFVSATRTSFDEGHTYYSSSGQIWCAHSQGQSSDGGMHYYGTITNGVNVCKYLNKNQGWNANQSPYYFEAWNGDNYDDNNEDNSLADFAYYDSSEDPHILNQVYSSHEHYDDLNLTEIVSNFS